MADIVNTNVEGLYAIRDSLVKFQEQMGSVQKEFIEAFSELESQMLTNARRKIQEIEERQHERDKKRRTDSFSCPQCGVRIILKINSDTAPCSEAHCNGVMRRVYLQSDYTREQQKRDKQELAAIREALDSYKKQKEEFVEVFRSFFTKEIANANKGTVTLGTCITVLEEYLSLDITNGSQSGQHETGTDQKGSDTQSKEISGAVTDIEGNKVPFSVNVKFGEDDLFQMRTGVKEFGNHASAATEWGTKYSEQYISNLSTDEVVALESYSGSGYDRVNQAARNMILERDLSSTEKETIHNLDSALEKASLPEDVVVYRAISESALASIAIHNGGSIEPGMVFQDDGFMSCSLVSDNPFANYEKCIFRITAPAGTHAAYLGDLSMYPTENELLVGRGHCIYINQVTEAPRNTLTNNPYQTENVLIIDGVLGI